MAAAHKNSLGAPFGVGQHPVRLSQILKLGGCTLVIEVLVGVHLHKLCNIKVRFDA